MKDKFFFTLWIAIAIFLFPFIIRGASCPIIFVHGSKGGGISGEALKDWHGALQDSPYTSAMERIINNGYQGYNAGSPLDCNVNTTLASTGGNRKKIYNFSYYNPDGSKGVIGSNGQYLPAILYDPDWHDETVRVT